MSFQYSHFLWLLVFLVVPVLVHFFDFRRIRRIQFSNVSFLNALRKQSTPQRRLEELLLLVCRILSIGFLVIAFAHPFIPSSDLSSNQRGSLVLDNSFSLMGACKSGDCIVENREIILSLADERSKGELSSIGSYRVKKFYSREELSSLLDDITFRKGQMGAVSSNGRAASLVVLSDFQTDILEGIIDSDSISYTLVPILGIARSNVRVDSVYNDRSSANSHNSRIVSVMVKNDGTINRENVLIRLTAGNQQIGSSAVSLEAGGKRIVQFEIRDSDLREFRIGVDDSEVPFDNDFFFVLPSVSPFKVSLVSDREESNLKAVFGNHILFDFHAYDSRNIDFEKVLDSDVLILSSFKEVPEWMDIESFDGKVVIIPSERIDVENYSRRLSIRIRESDTVSRRLDIENLENPFFQGIFDELDARVELPFVKTFFSASGGDVLLGGSDPFLQYFNEKNLFWFSGPVSEVNARFSNHSIFLPLMYRIAESSRNYNSPLSYELTDEPIDLSLNLQSESVPTLLNEEGQYIPDLNYTSSNLVFTLPYDLNEPGIYYLMSDRDTLERIALNYPKSETRMNFMTYDDLVTYFDGWDNVQVLDSSSPERLQAAMDEMENGTPLWKYALILALMFLLAETAIHRWLK